VLEGLQIALRVVRSALFPRGEEDADPFESDRAHRSVMAFTLSPLFTVMGLSPRAVADGTAGKFVKGLTQELRTGLSEVDACFSFALFAAALVAATAAITVKSLTKILRSPRIF